MEEIDTVIINGLDRYFNTLCNVGYVNDDKVNRLLLLIFINEMLSGDFSHYITDDDYQSILNVLYCLGNCMIDMPSFKVFNDSIYNVNNNENLSLRYDDSLIRSTESYIIRKV